MESYKEKIIRFNLTEKYAKECDFLAKLIDVSMPEFVLDFGCGNGYFMDKYLTDGYDVNNYYDKKNTGRYYLNELPNNDYSYITMSHVFAHITNPSDVLRILRGKYPEATLTVITPNAEWLDEGYIGDETVIKHYTQKELKELFESCGYKVTLLGQFGEYKNGQNERIFLQAHV